MTIRPRTEQLQRMAGSTAAVALASAAAVHGLWATGSAWPTASQEELADLVVGRRPMPGPVACAVVAGALTVAASATARASAGAAGQSRTVASIVAAALLARGIGGALVDVGHLGEQTPEFRRWNRRFYNPLCLSLGALVAVGRPSRP